jgi:hypothetical protein
MDGYASKKFNRKNLLYIYGHPHTHGNVPKFINSCRCSLFSANFLFEEHLNDNDFFKKRKSIKFVDVHAKHSMFPDDKLLVNCIFYIPLNTHKRKLILGLRVDIPLGHKNRSLTKCVF